MMADRLRISTVKVFAAPSGVFVARSTLWNSRARYSVGDLPENFLNTRLNWGERLEAHLKRDFANFEIRVQQEQAGLRESTPRNVLNEVHTVNSLNVSLR
jgi:hypothetical protein